MDNTNRLRSLRSRKQSKFTIGDTAEVNSVKWEFINMTEQEEDLIFRMYRLVGDRWDLIAGRVVGREAKGIERYWIMRNCDHCSHKRRRVHKFYRFSISPP
uniref:Trichomeless2 n=1 Tax=Arabidopsis thaliana TaxID=3702 RepID=D3GKX4_ARATH|nr:trichomeless2 [Arabidopsis thaliana]